MPRTATFSVLLALLVVADPASAQIPSPGQSDGTVTPVPVPANPGALKKLTKTLGKKPKNVSIRPSYVGPCGGSYICYDDSVIICGGGGRPYENVPTRECYCWADNCP